MISCLLCACSVQSGAGDSWRRFVSAGKILFTSPSGLIAVGGFLVAVIAILLAFRYRGSNNQVKNAEMDTLMETATQLEYPAQGDSTAFLLVLQGDKELAGKRIPLFPAHATSLGRSQREVEFAFQANRENSVVSRKHCEIRGEDHAPFTASFRIIDLGSTHGTFLNGERLSVGGEGKNLSPGDQIELGPADQGGVLLQYKYARSETKTQIESPDSSPTYLELPSR
jgi:hypothetical protein